MPRVVLPGAPLQEFRLEAGAEHWRERGDGADIQIQVRPTVESPTDAGTERVVNGRMTERAGRADALHSIAGDFPDDADDGIEFQEAPRHLDVVHIELPRLERRDDGW